MSPQGRPASREAQLSFSIKVDPEPRCQGSEQFPPSPPQLL